MHNVTTNQITPIQHNSDVTITVQENLYKYHRGYALQIKKRRRKKPHNSLNQFPMRKGGFSSWASRKRGRWAAAKHKHITIEINM